MKIEKIKISNLKYAPYNPRKLLKKNDVEYIKLKNSIEKFGFVEPVIFNKTTGNIVGGHQRVTILKDLGEKEVECVIVELNEQDEKALNIALNKISGEWDSEKLEELLRDLKLNEYDLELTGFDLSEIDGLLGLKEELEAEEDDFDSDAELANITEPTTKRGQVWQLGNHRLMCGDSTLNEDVEKLMADSVAHLFLTDPPYNVDLGNETVEQAKARNRRTDGLVIQNDKMSDSSFLEFLTSAFINGKNHLQVGRSFYIWHADSEGLNFRLAVQESGLKTRQCIIWNKSSLAMGRQDYQWKHEPCLYGWKDGASHYFIDDRKQTTVIDCKKPNKSKEHPTMKPLELFDKLIKNSSKQGELVLDLFGGSGTTLIACEQINRICYMMELDEKYCDVIIKRWEKLTGETATLIEE